MIRCHVDCIPLRLEEFHSDTSKNSRHADVQLRIGKIHTQTAAGAFGKTDEILRERLISAGSLRISKPAAGVESLARRENALIVVLNIDSLTDGDARRDGVGAVLNSGVKDTRESLRGPVRKPERLKCSAIDPEPPNDKIEKMSPDQPE